MAALTATFRADFQQFEASLQKAQVNTTAFDRATKNALIGLRREIESFKGENLAIQAAKMVEAVNRIGGVSKLTDSELKRLQATLDETAQKAMRFGDAVPQGIAKMRAEIAALPKATTAASGGFSSLSSILGKLGPLLPITSIAGVATALIGMGKSALESAGKINDLAGKTGLSTEAIQRMQAVANQTGTTIEAFTNATFKLGVNVAEGTAKARKAVEDLGLSYTALKNQKPEEQFATVVKALEGVDNQQERNRIGMALFGKQFSEIAAAVEEGYSKIADAASVSSDRQIKALDAAGDAWQKFKDDTGKSVQQILGNIVIGMQTPQDIRELTKAQRDMLTEAIKNGENLVTVWARIRGVSRETDIKLPTMSAGGTDAARDYVKELEAMRVKLAALSPLQRAQLDAALKMGEEQGNLADQFGLSAEELRIYTQEVKATTGAQNGLIDSQERALKWFEESKKKNKEQAEALHDVNLMLLKGTHSWADYAALTEKATKRVGESIVATATALRGAGPLGGIDRMWEPLKAAVKPMSMIGQTMGGNIMKGLGDVFKNQFGSTILAAVTGGGNVLQSLGSVVGQGLGTSIAKSFTGMLGSVMSTVLPGIGALLGPALGWIGGLFTNKNTEEVKKYNAEIQKVRDSLIETHGSLDDLEKKANIVGLSFKEAWGHKGEQGLKQFNALIKEFETRVGGLNEEFAELFGALESAGEGLPDHFIPVIQRLMDMGVLTGDLAEQFTQLSMTPGLKDMEDAAEALGVRLESLGPAFDVKKLSADADAFLKNLRILERGGADIGGVLSDAAGGISRLVNEAIRLEAELPEGLRRFVEELAKSGKLVDENGNALTDLSRLNWAEPMSRSVDRLISKFEELINVIINQLGPAIEGIPSLPSGPSESVPDFGGAQASGGDYLVRRPTLFLAGEAGTERATFTPANGAGGNTGGTIHVPITIDGRVVADVILDRVGNRLSVRGAR